MHIKMTVQGHGDSALQTVRQTHSQMRPKASPRHACEKYKKLRYREEHSASVVPKHCTLWHLSETNNRSTA